MRCAMTRSAGCEHFLTDPGVGAAGNRAHPHVTAHAGRRIRRRADQARPAVYASLTVSGVITMFRKDRARRRRLLGSDMLTEDIDISWKCTRWRVVYCWILMPETVKGPVPAAAALVEGGIQVLMKYAGALAADDDDVAAVRRVPDRHRMGVLDDVHPAAHHQCRVPLPQDWHVSSCRTGMLLVATACPRSSAA